MRSPTIKTIMESLNLSRDQATELRKAIKDIESFNKYDQIDQALDLANKLLNAYGIEAIRVNTTINHYYFDIGLLYVNRGDTYKTTLIYDTSKKYFSIESWGNWAERQKNNYVL